MDAEKRQSIKFDIEQLEMQLKTIEREIEYKEDELKFISPKVKGMGAVSGGLAYGLAALALLGTRNPKIAGQAFSLGALNGADNGYDLSEKALIELQAKIALLKQERNLIIRKIEDAKAKLR